MGYDGWVCGFAFLSSLSLSAEHTFFNEFGCLCTRHQRSWPQVRFSERASMKFFSVAGLYVDTNQYSMTVAYLGHQGVTISIPLECSRHLLPSSTLGEDNVGNCGIQRLEILSKDSFLSLDHGKFPLRPLIFRSWPASPFLLYPLELQ